MGYALLQALARFFNANVKKREEKRTSERGIRNNFLFLLLSCSTIFKIDFLFLNYLEISLAHTMAMIF